MNNPNCDGAGPHCAGPVKVLPMHKFETHHGNLILCRNCFNREIEFRAIRNQRLAKDCAFALPSWDSLKVYEVGR